MSENQSVSGQSVFLDDETIKRLKEVEEEKVRETREYQEKYKIAINNLEFDAAKEIQDKLKEINSRQSKEKIDQMKKLFHSEFDTVLENHKTAKKRILRRNYHKELDARTNFTTQFILLQKKHIHDLAALEQQMVEEYQFKAERPSQKVIALFEQAKQVALQQNFEEAKNLKKKAEQLKQETVKNTEKEVTHSYKIKIGETLDIQEKDIELLSQKLDETTQKIEKNRLKELQELDNSSKILFAKFIKKYQATVNSLPLTDTEKQTITRYALKKYNETMIEYKLIDKTEAQEKKQTKQNSQKQQKTKFVSKRDFIEKEFQVQFTSNAYKRALSRNGSQTSSQYPSQSESQYSSQMDSA